MSKIYLSTPQRARYGSVNSVEGETVRLDVFRDDFSLEQEFELQFTDPFQHGFELITNHDVSKPIKVRFEAGDTQPKTISLELFDDNLVRGEGSVWQGIQIVPGKNTTEEGFEIVGDLTNRWGENSGFGISIAENDYPGVYATLLNNGNGDGPISAMEGGQIKFKFERKHETGRAEVFFKPATEDDAYFGKLKLNYDSANPFKVAWEEGDTEAKYLTIDVRDDDMYLPLQNYMTWHLVPGENVSRIIGPDLDYDFPVGNGGWGSPVYFMDNDNMPIFGMRAPRIEVTEGSNKTFSFEVSRGGRDFNGSSKAWIKLEGLGDNPADPARFGRSSELIEVSFNASTPKLITLNLADDATYQGTQQIKATIVKAEHRWWNGDVIDAAPEGVGAAVSVTIYDNDPKPEVVSYPTVAAHRFYNTANGTHFYTPSEAERDNIIATIPSYTYEGVGFQMLSSNTPGADEMYRFYNPLVGYHLFTANEDERDNIIATLPNYQYEGVGFYASETAEPGMTAVHRFYNAQTGAHFMTSNVAERDNVMNTLPTFQYEGIGFYVPTGDTVIA